MRRPTVALLSDFGTRDPYVAALRGVIRSIVDCDLLDLSHEIGPGNIFEAAFFLEAVVDSLRNRDSRTVVCAVVDPGVGTGRSILAIRTDDLWFTAPDNGIMARCLSRGHAVHRVTREDLFRGDSRTFHGRDRFAPIAASIAGGLEVEGLGPSIAIDDLVPLDYDPARYETDQVTGTIVSIDRFGNLITDIRAGLVEVARPWKLQVEDRVIDQEAATYHDGKVLDLYMIVGSRGTIEVSGTGKSAAAILQPDTRTGSSVVLRSTGE